MKFRPILFSTEMVQAILEGSKTQTRRTKGLEKINILPDRFMADGFIDGLQWLEDLETLEDFSIKSPYGQVGDVLWVRESCTWIMREHAHDLLEGCRENTQWVYKASMHEDFMKYAKEKYKYKWKPSIHMPKEACRLFLKIKDIRVERLQDISRGDAMAEGIKSRVTAVEPFDLIFQPPNCPNYYYTAKQAFKFLWQSINGEQSWNDNPWVWVIEFERINKPENFK